MLFVEENGSSGYHRYLDRRVCVRPGLGWAGEGRGVRCACAGGKCWPAGVKDMLNFCANTL